MNYRIEREHDERLIELVEGLENGGHSGLLADAFQIPRQLGALQNAQRRQPFDVELTFEHLSIVVESKVDSDENGRWSDPQQWQTDEIINNVQGLDYLNPNIAYRYITYGTSEFYSKAAKRNGQPQYVLGPAAGEFIHLRLDRMIDLVRHAEEVLPPCVRRRDWLELMGIERRKREEALELLRQFAGFRASYLDIDRGGPDFPRHRLLFCAPELAFPVFHQIAERWNVSMHTKQFGRVIVYPVGRQSPPVHDSILNLWEMWRGNTPANLQRWSLYFEINEDYNLNLKSENGLLQQEDREQIWERLGNANWPDGTIACRRDYRQVALVLYEIDFGLLSGLPEIGQVVEKLAQTLKAAVGALG